MSIRDYETDMTLIRQLLTSGTYAKKLMEVSHREEVEFVVDMDDVHRTDPSLCLAIKDNTRRYVQLFSRVIDALLPDYKTASEVPQKDTLDVFIEHRLLAEQRKRTDDSNEQFVSKYPPELMRRFEVCLPLLSQCDHRLIDTCFRSCISNRNRFRRQSLCAT
jgi:hypothetical protein